MADRKSAVLNIPSEILCAALGLPAGAVISHAGFNHLHGNLVQIVVDGAGWPLMDGFSKIAAPIATMDSQGVIDLGLPKDAD